MLIYQRVKEKEIEMSRICNFMKCTKEEIYNTYKLNTIDTNSLLRWSKLLEYDFFRIYSQHLILYSPKTKDKLTSKENQNISLPMFRKNIYTMEIIDFILELIRTEKKTKYEVINEYGIPKTTLFKWIQKYDTRNDRKSYKEKSTISDRE